MHDWLLMRELLVFVVPFVVWRELVKHEVVELLPTLRPNFSWPGDFARSSSSCSYVSLRPLVPATEQHLAPP